MKNQNNTVAAFCAQNGFDEYYFHSVWNGYGAYAVSRKKDAGLVIGYPDFALEKGGIVRLAESSEVFSILSLSSNANKNGEEL